MPDLAELYDLHAEDCARAAEQTDNPRYRPLLLKCATEWREAAQALRQSNGTALGTALPQRRKDRPSAHPLTSIELIDTAENG